VTTVTEKVVPVRATRFLQVERRAQEALRVQDLPPEPLVSCLCVTQNRPEFIPWLLWNFDRQEWKRRELVIVDSSNEPLEIEGRAEVRVIHAPRGTSAGKARNIALRAAAGEMLAWFDDDDWQHPERLSRLVPLLRTCAESWGASHVGPSHGWFLDVDERGCQAYRWPEHAIFNGSLFLTSQVRNHRFPEWFGPGEDTRWIMDVIHAGAGAALVDPDPVLFFWICHDRNGANRRVVRRLLEDAAPLRERIGAAWGETSRKLEEVRGRLPAPPSLDLRLLGLLGTSPRAHRLLRELDQKA
jgi:glycosyltransferase involved in cell wall biosynthesis